METKIKDTEIKSGKPVPTKQFFCEFLAKSSFELSTIVDVGTKYQTKELRENFKQVHQILIEPQNKYNTRIKELYKNNIFTILNVGCDSHVDTLYIHEKGEDFFKLPTHNKLNCEISDTEVKIETLDNICKELKNNLLLKIDTDGHEVGVLQGGRNYCLKKCAFVIIETTFKRFAEITDIMTKENFELFQIVDLCYFQNILWQVDLIFVRKDVREETKIFNPEFLAKDYYEYKPEY